MPKRARGPPVRTPLPKRRCPSANGTTTENGTCDILDFPTEVFTAISQFLAPQCFAKFSMACKQAIGQDRIKSYVKYAFPNVDISCFPKAGLQLVHAIMNRSGPRNCLRVHDREEDSGPVWSDKVSNIILRKSKQTKNLKLN